MIVLGNLAFVVLSMIFTDFLSKMRCFSVDSGNLPICLCFFSYREILLLTSPFSHMLSSLIAKVMVLLKDPIGTFTTIKMYHLMDFLYRWKLYQNFSWFLGIWIKNLMENSVFHQQIAHHLVLHLLMLRDNFPLYYFPISPNKLIIYV